MNPPRRPAVSLAALATLVVAPSLRAQQTTALPLETIRKAVVTVHALDAGGATIASGTGFFVAPQGLVVTAAHVLTAAAGCAIELSDGETMRCSVAASDTAKDVMMLLVPGTAPAMLQWGSSGAARDGDHISVVSNPLGQLPGTLSEGIISASRVVAGTKLLQISAPISHGSSGGPLLNAQSQVIGVIRSTIERGQALNFATATDAVRNLARDPAAVAEARSILRTTPVAARTRAADAAAAAPEHDIAVGQSVSGVLTEHDEVYGDSTYYQRWRFTTTPGSDVTIDLVSPDFHPALIVRGLDSAVVNLDGGPGCSARVSLNLPEAGPYTILVNTSSTPTAQTGRFTLSLTAGRRPLVPGNTGHCPPGGRTPVHTIAAGQTVHGTLGHDDDLYTDTTYYQRWQLRAEPGRPLTVDLSSPTFDPVILFFGLDTLVIDDDGGPGCASRVSFVPPTPGPYTIFVNTTSDPPRQSGPFTLSVTPGAQTVDPPNSGDCRYGPGGGDAPEQTFRERPATHAIATGESVHGRIGRNDELWVDSSYIQRWALHGRAGRTVTVDLKSDDFDAYLMVHGPGLEGGDVSDDDSGGRCNSRIVLTFPETADYQIVVNTAGRQYATGAFVLSVTTGRKALSSDPCRHS